MHSIETMQDETRQKALPEHGKSTTTITTRIRWRDDFLISLAFAPQKKEISARRLDKIFYFLVIHLLSPIKCRQTFRSVGRSVGRYAHRFARFWYLCLVSFSRVSSNRRCYIFRCVCVHFTRFSRLCFPAKFPAFYRILAASGREY